MRYTVINGDITIKNLKISAIATASSLQIGDTKCIRLSSIFESPPESLIVGVTVPLVPLEEPRR